MRCLSISGPTFEEAERQIKEARCDLLEFRLDLMSNIDLEGVRKLKEMAQLPIIFTLHNDPEKIREFAALAPDYFDTGNMQISLPSKQIASHHDFDKTPKDLKQLVNVEANLAKLACKANTTCDALRMLDLVRERKILGMSLGEMGEISRILGPIFGVPWTYTYSDSHRKMAEGQIAIDKLPHLSPSSQIFGLMGGMQIKSLGTITHNALLKALGQDGVYVNFPLMAQELSEFFNLAHRLGFRGLSVTMPHKESVLPFLDLIDPDARKIGAANTLLFDEGRLIGTNTDGRGALDAIEAKGKVESKKVQILGAGGAARALIFEAKKRGADVWIFNRTVHKAELLAQEFDAQSGLSSDYDILINTTPSPEPINPSLIRERAVVMDIVAIPKLTPFLASAAVRGCTLIYGYEMYVNQAVLQFDLWFSGALDPEKMRQVLQEECLHAL